MIGKGTPGPDWWGNRARHKSFCVEFELVDVNPLALDLLFGRHWREDPRQIDTWESEGGALNV